MNDLRFALRQLRKSPGFTLIAVLTLALCIGANTAIFSVVDAVLLRPLPFKDPAQLVSVWEYNLKQGDAHQAVGGANFSDWKTQNQVFKSLAAYFDWNYNLTGGDEPRRLHAVLVSGEFFQTLGTEAAIGRVITSADDQDGSDDVVVLSHTLWQQRFGGRSEVVGQAIVLNGRNHTVIGVMPAGFNFPQEETEIWRPMAIPAAQMQNREGKWLKVIGRLKAGFSLNQASAGMSAIAQQLAQQYPASNAGWDVNLVPLHEEMVGKVSRFLFVSLGAVGFVLLIACVNIANLLLARAFSRQKEIAVRAALGASRPRLIRQFLIESLVLAVVGGAAGLLIAFWGNDALLALSPASIPRLKEAGIDGRVLWFTLLISSITTLLFGLMPAWQASKPDLSLTLKEEGRSTAGTSVRKLRGVLVAAEVAVSIVLLIGAGLMIKSFIQLQSVKAGFDPRNLLTMEVTLPSAKYGQNQQQAAFFRQAIESIKTLPGVEVAGAVQDLPFRFNSNSFPISIEGRALAPQGTKGPMVIYRTVTEDYLRTLGIPLITGRGFTPQDGPGSAPVIVINQAMARRFWPGEDPLGKQIRFGEAGDPAYTIVGVVGDIKHMGLDAEEGAVMYQPHAQKSFGWLRWMTIVVRTNVEPLSLNAAVRNRIQEIDKDQPVYNVGTMEQLLAKSIAQTRFSTFLLGVFALFALILSAIGIYGVVSYAVSQRTREIGIRMALGAARSNIFRLIVGEAMALFVLSLGLGLVAALGATRLLKSLLYGVGTNDPITFASIAFLTATVAFIAAWLPARRAARLDPIIALRGE
jgi:putative ABC transport system permease protein